MEVIGAGFQKTGTSSLCEALNKLGYVTHHGGHMHACPARMKFWLDAFNEMEQGQDSNKVIDWHLYFKTTGGRYTATTDFPTALFYKELLAKYPNAKVILTQREAKPWVDSRMSMMTWELNRMQKWTFRLLHWLRHPRYRLYLPLCDRLERYAYGYDMTADPREQAQREDDYITALQSHDREVISHVPPERLLIFRVEDGWVPLCRFLDKPIPKEPFPHVNEGLSQLEDRVNSWTLSDMLEAPYYLLAPYPSLASKLSRRRQRPTELWLSLVLLLAGAAVAWHTFPWRLASAPPSRKP